MHIYVTPPSDPNQSNINPPGGPPASPTISSSPAPVLIMKEILPNTPSSGSEGTAFTATDAPAAARQSPIAKIGKLVDAILMGDIEGPDKIRTVNAEIEGSISHNPKLQKKLVHYIQGLEINSQGELIQKWTITSASPELNKLKTKIMQNYLKIRLETAAAEQAHAAAAKAAMKKYFK